MAKIKGGPEFRKRIRDNYSEVELKIMAVMEFWAANIIKDVKLKQPPQAESSGKYWRNRTGAAAAGMFVKTFNVKRAIGLLLAHSVDYGVYLELANDRQNAIIMPQLKRVITRVIRDIKLVMEGKI